MSNLSDEFIYDTPRRLMGSETEYTCSYEESVTPLDSVVDPKSVVFQLHHRKLWLKNGGLIYIDLGNIPEYATPECKSAEEVMHHEIAGTELVSSALKRKVYKRSAYQTVTNQYGALLLKAGGMGHHENYQIALEPDFLRTQNSQMLESYLATRAIWAGAGIVGVDGYEIHQKARDISIQTQARTEPGELDWTRHGDKYPFCLKDINEKNEEARLEIRLGDGNMSPWAIRTKFAMTSFVLRLIEHDEFPPELLIGDKRGSLRREVSLNPNSEFQTEAGNTTQAALHQQSIARACIDFAARHPLYQIPRDELQAALDIEAVGCDIDDYFNGADNLELLARRIDWAAKLFRHYQELGRNDVISTYNLDAVKIDLQWEDTAPDAPAARWYKKCGNTADHIAVRQAHSTPPRTRAASRVAYLRDTTDALKEVDWSYAYIHSDSHPNQCKKIYYESAA